MLVASFLMTSECHFAFIVVCICLAVPWVGLWSVIVTFPGHTHLRFQEILCHVTNRI